VRVVSISTFFHISESARIQDSYNAVEFQNARNNSADMMMKCSRESLKGEGKI
jgi:hypothetical protein